MSPTNHVWIGPEAPPPHFLAARNATVERVTLMSDLGVMPCLSPQPSRSPSCIKCLTKKTQTVAERLRVLNGFAVPVNKCRDAGFVCVFAFTYNCKTARRPKLAICTMRLYAETDLISSFFFHFHFHSRFQNRKVFTRAVFARTTAL